MGRKSNLKMRRRIAREREKIKNCVDKTTISCDGPPDAIYRFFTEEWQAKALCKGNVWIGTLETCRSYENEEQGDPGEASINYVTDRISGDGTDPEFVEKAAKAGFAIDTGTKGVSIINCINTKKAPDAYVLCTTKEYSPEVLKDSFGEFCVKISDPYQFYQEVTASLYFQSKIELSAYGEVIYKDRDYRWSERQPGPVGFVKPPDKYAHQKEFRFLWVPKNHKELAGKAGILVTCPEAAKYCSLVD